MPSLRTVLHSILAVAIALSRVLAPAQKPASFANPAALRFAPNTASDEAATLKDIFGDSATERTLEESLAPYLTEAVAESKTLLQPLAHSGERRTYAVGDNLVVLSASPVFGSVPVILPEGHWVNFWTGAQSLGGTPFTAELPAGTLPMWARGGSVIERRSSGYDGLFERRLTDRAKSCLESCLFDLLPAFTRSEPAKIRDADGRTITRSQDALGIEGKPGHMTVRWRFTRVSDVRVNGTPVQIQSSPEGYYASFDHGNVSTVEWTVRSFMPRSY